MSRNIFQETQAESHAGAHAQRERGEGRGVAEKLSQVQIRTRAPVSIHAWARVRAVRRNSKKKQKRNGRQVDQNCFHTNKPRLTGHYFYALFLSCRTYFLLAGVKSSNYLFRPFACVPRNRYSITDCHSTKRIRAKVTRGVKRERDYSYFSEGGLSQNSSYPYAGRFYLPYYCFPFCISVTFVPSLLHLRRASMLLIGGSTRSERILIYLFGFNVRKQLRLRATPQGRSAGNFGHLRVL